MNELRESTQAVGEKVRGGDDNAPKKLARKVLVPLGAALASAAASYAARKVPKLVEERLLPKLRDRSGPRDLAADVAQRARDLAQAHTPLGGSPAAAGSDGMRRSRRSQAERARERAQRDARRRARRGAGRR